MLCNDSWRRDATIGCRQRDFGNEQMKLKALLLMGELLTRSTSGKDIKLKTVAELPRPVLGRDLEMKLRNFNFRMQLAANNPNLHGS